MTRLTVSEYDDLRHAQLSERGKDRVLRELASGEHDTILHIHEEFAREDKDLETLEGTRALFGITDVRHETDKAWQVSQVPIDYPDEAHREGAIWIPKSVSELYCRDPNRGTKPQTSPQKGLSEFGGGR